MSIAGGAPNDGRALSKSGTARFSMGGLSGGIAYTLMASPSAVAFRVSIFAPLGADYATSGGIAGMLGAAAMELVAANLSEKKQPIQAPRAPAPPSCRN